MKISEIPGNHQFVKRENGLLENENRFKDDIICKICDLHLLMNESEIAIFPKGINIVFDTKIELIYNTLSCAEMVIKNILE